MRADLKIKGKIAVGHIMLAVLPVLPRHVQATLQRRYVDWLISASWQQAILLGGYCPTCRCRTCAQHNICVNGCGDCKLSWLNYKNMFFIEAAYTFDKCQRFKGGKENERNSIMELLRQ